MILNSSVKASRNQPPCFGDIPLESRRDQASLILPSPSVSLHWIVGWINGEARVEEKQIIPCSASPWPSYPSHIIEQGKTIDIWPRGTPKQMYFWDTVPELGPCLGLQQHVLNSMVGSGGTLSCCLVPPKPYISSYCISLHNPNIFSSCLSELLLDILTLAVEDYHHPLVTPFSDFLTTIFLQWEEHDVSCGSSSHPAGFIFF